MEGENILELLKNVDNKYDSIDSLEADLWFSAKSRCSFNHCWFSVRDGILSCVYFRRLESNRRGIVKKVKSSVIFLCIFLLTGCIDNELGKENMRKANINHNFLNYKQEIYSGWGKECAFYEGRIYFFQNEGIPGIYSMDARGKEKRIEIEVQNIRKIQVLEDGIYFAGPIQGDELNRYTIYRKRWDRSSAENYLMDNTQKERNVWDFFMDDDHTMVVVNVSPYIPYMYLYFTVFTVDAEKKWIPLSEYKEYLKNYEQDNVDDNRTNIFGYEDILFVVETGLHNNSENEYLYDWGEQNLSVYQMKINQILFFRNQELYNERGCDSVLQTIYKDEFVISNGNKLLWIEQNASEYSKVLEISDMEEVKYSIKKDEGLITIASDGKNEYLYLVNLETLQIEHIFSVPNKEKVLAIDQERLYTVSEEGVQVYKSKNEKYIMVNKIEWKNKLKDTNKLEMAGTTIFKYDVKKENGEISLEEFLVLD